MKRGRGSLSRFAKRKLRKSILWWLPLDEVQTWFKLSEFNENRMIARYWVVDKKEEAQHFKAIILLTAEETSKPAFHILLTPHRDRSRSHGSRVRS